MASTKEGPIEGASKQEQLYRHPNARKTPEAEPRDAKSTDEGFASPQEAPSRASQSTPACSDTVWDPIHALSRRSRSDTDDFFSPLLQLDQEPGSAHSSGPLDYADTFARSESDPIHSTQPEEQARAAGVIGKPPGTEQHSDFGPRQRSLAFPSYSASDAGRGRVEPTAKGQSSPTGLSSETSEDLRRLFSPAGRGFTEALEQSSWRKGPVGPVLGTFLGTHMPRTDPHSSGSSSSIIDPFDFSRGGRSRRNTGCSDSLGSFGKSSPTLLHPPIYRPTYVDKEVQTEDSAIIDEANRIRGIIELRQARSDMHLLFAENRGLKRQLYDALTCVRALRQQRSQELPLAAGFTSSPGVAGMLGRLGGTPGTGMVDPALHQALPSAYSDPAAMLRNVPPAGFHMTADPIAMQGLQQMPSVDLFRHGSAVAAPPAAASRPEMPASLNQQRILAELASRGLAMGGSHELGAVRSPLDEANLYASASSEGDRAEAAAESSTSRLTSTAGWPSLAEAQKQFARAKVSTPTEPHGRGQEASIVLQQQLKSGTADAKRSVVGLVKSCILALSHDRHGNFLVQRALGVDADLAWSLKGHFVELAMSQFGCHVVQRVLDGEERVKMAVVEELLSSRLEESLTSRHSVHVWQKVLEIDWTHASFRSTIFAVMNRQMKGKWAKTARQETGSIICQNIFESADADEKSDCLQEVLAEAEECASNQWGVWVVQHIIEHGSDPEKKAALEGLLRSAVKLTLSQYGQKAIMSGLKSGDRTFVDKYVETLCETHPSGSSGTGSRRSALVDVALAPQGLQIVTQLLTSVSPEMREKIIATVRKNSVFLKGSKTGLKVHQLCERARAFSGY
ncbi:uncharacterized protein PSFLO_05121 [Pseudozyma flocculosa]|uniref:PUM-HD domain-containing protein n=1 Tax=Pseudozyma flocculosa TaxID=84751 RepID=A0A5C3F675_9BASI|nr:uncharacterized protein PSFLO_05121 [Pseudozyma flocculosa]